MKYNIHMIGAAVLSVSALVACDGDDGENGSQGPAGPAGPAGASGSPGQTSLIQQTPLPMGSNECIKGGILFTSGLDTDNDGNLAESEIEESHYLCHPTLPNATQNFNRIASFPVCQQIEANCDTDEETAAEIVAASEDGMTLIYTDSPAEQIGFVDLTDPANPIGLGVLELAGEPTSVAVLAGYAIVGINTSEDFVNVSGELAVVDIATQALVTTLELGGQPDSVAVSPDNGYIVVAIENERDEDLGDGVPPQAPAGDLVVVVAEGAPDTWTSSRVDLTGLADLYGGDPEPEYVDINSDNMAVVTLQENNHIILIDLTSAEVAHHFSAGSVDLTQIDVDNESPAVITLSESQDGVLREPDGVAWINNDFFATADEGDLDGGSRGFTVFNTQGEVVYSSGNSLDHIAVRLGHYPDDRSDNKGNEPENIEMGSYGGDRYLFVASERASLVLVYDAADPTNPMYKQTLPAALGPEGVLAIPDRNLLIAASEEDSRGDGFRSALNIYNYSSNPATYPALYSADRIDGTPIPWSAQSGLSADPWNVNRLYSVDDSYFQSNRIFTIDIGQSPAKIVAETYIRDSNDVLAGLAAESLADASVGEDDPSRISVFDEADLAAMINADNTVNIDPEGIAKASDRGYWVASEGSGTVGDEGRPVNTLNMVIKTDPDGVIEQVFTLPAEVNEIQVRFGFEGITESDGLVYVAFQRAWGEESNPRIGVLDPSDGTWTFFEYPLDAVESVNGGWVGLSDITALGSGQFLVLERDNNGGPDAAIKRLYSFDATGLVDGDTLTKTLVTDLLPELTATGGMPVEKVEGLAVTASGDVWISSDNDGVEDNSGENVLINVGAILP